jgi:predicted ATPase
MDGITFGQQVQTCLRASGNSQHHLADALGLHHGVLNRKLRGSGNAYLNQLEVKRIILTLINWNAISTHEEVLQFLELAKLRPSSFTADEWQTYPLNLLVTEPRQVIPHEYSSMPTALHNLPVPLTPLVGRAWLVERLQQLLGRDEVREVTLIGAGGCGKTRLALHVATELLSLFPHGIWFVALEGVRDPEQVPASISQALGLSSKSKQTPLQNLIAHLKNKKMLLVLDSFEQITSAAPCVSELLTAARYLKMMITSRTVLHLYGEHEFSVPPLDIPDLNFIPEAAKLVQYGAIQLFLQRAQAIVPDFALTAENKASIAQICAWVDGLPLGLELAAARAKLLSPPSLFNQLLEMRLDLLTRGAHTLPLRQRTLRQTFEWSYNLLSPIEQYCFTHLGVLPGSWCLENVTEMMQKIADEQSTPSAIDTVSILDILGKLVDSSLLIRQQSADGQIRFTMLKTLREYALEQLAAKKESDPCKTGNTAKY